jgi:hypothetical protein
VNPTLTGAGVVGCLMTGLLAWLMGKNILETKGLGWAWFIHVARQSRYPPADARMTVCEYEDGHLALVYRGQAMRFREIPAPRPIVATPKPAGVHPPAPQRRPAPANHPWRQRYDRLHDRVSPGESIPGHFRPRGANV